jgi:hypothetical protein
MDTTTLLIIIVVVLILFGGGYFRPWALAAVNPSEIV